MADTNYNYTSLILPMNGANAGTTFTDYSKNQNTVITATNATTSTTKYKFYGSSGSFNGSTTVVQLDSVSQWYLGSGDFTVEAYVNTTTHNTVMCVVGTYSGASAGWEMQIRSDTSSLTFGNGDTVLSAKSWVPVDGTWYHIAVCRQGTNLRSFVDGTQLGTTVTDSTNITGASQYLNVGRLPFVNQQYFNGYIQDLRITTGYARYTANFTPPGPLVKTISGIVKDDTGANAIRTVWASPRLAPSGAKTTTSASDGTFSMQVADTQCLVNVLDDAAGTQYNALTYDLITPV